MGTLNLLSFECIFFRFAIIALIFYNRIVISIGRGGLMSTGAEHAEINVGPDSVVSSLSPPRTIRGRMVNALRRRWDNYLLFAIASVSLVALGLIVFFIFSEGLPIFYTVSVTDFFGATWLPTFDPPRFGALPMILGTVLVTVGSMAIAIPLGLASAAFIAEVAPGIIKDIAKSALELLAGIPSVVYGFFGLMVVAPYFQNLFDLATGRCALTAAVILAVMALPTIASLSEDALTAVPKNYREASMALGATGWQTIWRVTIPAAFSGLISALILGTGRAVGETMAVLMVAGNAPQLTGSFLKPIRTLTSSIALEMGETPFGSDHYHALFALGALLLVITLGMNLFAEWFRGRLARRHTG
jgi:phosphate transport system permease protein